ncbi:MAG TPA: hypothetical protein VNB64_02110 [Solirubrobacteraceae bacterium]|nr:hypothetical protein [Solirubrobacteraceae bacterium]
MVKLDPVNEQARALWRGVLDLATELPPRDWTLVGGLMVQLHTYRYGQITVRPTEDVDVLGDSRVRPESVTELIARKLVELGFEAAPPTGLHKPGLVYRFCHGDQVVDVLGPDGLRHTAKTLGNSETIEVKGGTQALKRTETVIVELDGRSARLRCPNLLGAVLLKARAVKARDKDEDRSDLALLLSCVEDPIAMRDELAGEEPQWLRAAAKRLDFDGPDLRSTLPMRQLTRARQAYELLSARQP